MSVLTSFLKRSGKVNTIQSNFNPFLETSVGVSTDCVYLLQPSDSGEQETEKK